MTGWEDAKVADPADDFAALVADAPHEAVETVFEAYAHTRVERPDPNLLVRARLVAELSMLRSLMGALARKNVGAVEVLTTQLRRLDDAVHTAEASGEDDYRRTSLAPVSLRTRPKPPPALVLDEDDDELPMLDEGLPTSGLPQRDGDVGGSQSVAELEERDPGDGPGSDGADSSEGADPDDETAEGSEADSGVTEDEPRSARG